MNKKIKARWLKALRSGKYEQTTNTLHKQGDGFCCLGVLCDLHRKSAKKVGWKPAYENGMSYLGSSEVLPEEVVRWAELEPTKCDLDNDGSDPRIDAFNRSTLSGLNDGGKSFKQIARVIEAQL